jgi:MFS family permease
MMTSSLRLFLIFSILSLLYILSQFYRVSNAVIAPNLIQDLRLNAETLGILGGAYFYSFALLQIPMGPMLDRIGPRLIVTFSALIGALGAFLFAFSGSFASALLGRTLIGVGMAPVLMGSMKVFILQFPRVTFILAGGITILLAFLGLWVLEVEKKKEGYLGSLPSEPEIGILQSIRLLLGSLAFWQIGAIAFFRYGTFVGLQGLWLGPYLINIKGYSPIQTGNVIILMAIGVIVGGPISGRLSDRTFRSRKGVALGGLSLYCLALFSLVGMPNIQSPFWYGSIFFLMGFSTSFGILIYSHAKELFPITISGTVMTLVNFFTMAGGAVFMPILGKVIESFPKVDHTYPAEAYHLSFLICFLSMTASLVFYSFSKKERSD